MSRRGVGSSQWWIVAGLLGLTLLPALGGITLLAGLAGSAAPESQRFHESPLPIVIHAVGGMVFCGLGAFQFLQGLRDRHPRYHRIAGRIVLPAGLAMSLSGLWMTQMYEIVPDQSWPVRAVRLLFGAATAAGLVLALTAILRREVGRHRTWMIRSYALGLGAGTQSLIGLPVAAVVGLEQLLSPGVHFAVLAAGWGVNALVAEWILRRPAHRAAPRPAASAR